MSSAFNGNYQVMVEGLRREIVSLQADNDILYSDVVIRDVEYERTITRLKKITTVFTALGNYLQYFSRPSKKS